MSTTSDYDFNERAVVRRRFLIYSQTAVADVRTLKDRGFVKARRVGGKNGNVVRLVKRIYRDVRRRGMLQNAAAKCYVVGDTSLRMTFIWISSVE